MTKGSKDLNYHCSTTKEIAPVADRALVIIRCSSPFNLSLTFCVLT
jgi:hypothetical protein